MYTKFDKEDFLKNPKSYLGRKIIVNREIANCNNRAISKSKEVYIARINIKGGVSISLLFDVNGADPERSGHYGAWEKSNWEYWWPKARDFNRDLYVSWNLDTDVIKEIEMTPYTQLEFDF